MILTAASASCIICLVRAPNAPSLICGGCYARTRGNLAVVAWAHAWLELTMLTPSPAWKPGTLRRGGGSRPPLRLELVDQREQIEAVLSSWVAAIAYEHQPALSGPADRAVPGMTQWLRARLPWLSDRRLIIDFAAELGEMRTAAHALAPWERHRRDLPVPCPRCGQLSLSLYGGDDGVICRNRECGETIPWYKYDREVRKWHDRMTTQTTAAA